MVLWVVSGVSFLIRILEGGLASNPLSHSIGVFAQRAVFSNACWLEAGLEALDSQARRCGGVRRTPLADFVAYGACPMLDKPRKRSPI